MAKILFNGKEYNANVFDYSLLTATPAINGSRVEGSKTSEELNAVWIGTQAEYEALAHRYSTCTYVITDDPYAVLNTNAAEVMRSASARFDGDSGLVPAPKAGDQSKVLVGSGAYITIPFKEFSGATAQYAGEKGLVPAPVHGEEAATLGGDGVWHKMPRVNGSREWNDDTTYYVAEESGNSKDILVSEGTNIPVWKNKTEAVRRMGFSTSTKAGEAGTVYAPFLIRSSTQHLSDQGWIEDISNASSSSSFSNSSKKLVSEKVLQKRTPYINNKKEYSYLTNLIVPTVKGVSKYAWSFDANTLSGKWIKQNTDNRVFGENQNGFIPKKNTTTSNRILFSDGTFVQYNSSLSGPISSTGELCLTERCVYKGLPTINNVHTYKSNTNYWAVPTAKGNKNEYLTITENGLPEWRKAIVDSTPKPFENTNSFISEKALNASIFNINTQHHALSSFNFYGVPTEIGGEGDLLISNGDVLSQWSPVYLIKTYTPATKQTDGKAGIVPQPLVTSTLKGLNSLTGDWDDLECTHEFFACTSVSDGEKGLVPQPIIGDQNRLLTSDNFWSLDILDQTSPSSLTDNYHIPNQRRIVYGLPKINDKYGGNYYWPVSEKPTASGQFIGLQEEKLSWITFNTKDLGNVFLADSQASSMGKILEVNSKTRFNVKGCVWPNSTDGEMVYKIKGDDLKWHALTAYLAISENKSSLLSDNYLPYDTNNSGKISVPSCNFHRIGTCKDGRKIYHLSMYFSLPMMLTGTSCITCYSSKHHWDSWAESQLLYIGDIDECTNFEMIDGDIFDYDAKGHVWGLNIRNGWVYMHKGSDDQSEASRLWGEGIQRHAGILPNSSYISNGKIYNIKKKTCTNSGYESHFFINMLYFGW